jgi:UPF0716 protein FxsA
MALLVVLFIAVPLVELWLILEVGSLIGVLPTIGLVLLTGLVGAALASSQGRAAWRRFNGALAEGRVPGREIFDGAMVIVGGALLLTPGFLTDAIGIIFLIPPTRAVIRRLLAGRVMRRAAARAPVFGWVGQARPAGPPAGGRQANGPSRSYDVEGTASEAPNPPRELGDPGRGD